MRFINLIVARVQLSRRYSNDRQSLKGTENYSSTRWNFPLRSQTCERELSRDQAVFFFFRIWVEIIDSTVSCVLRCFRGLLVNRIALVTNLARIRGRIFIEMYIRAEFCIITQTRIKREKVDVVIHGWRFI